MQQINVEKILKEYDEKLELYSSFIHKTEQLIREILSENKIEAHSVTSRVKERDSLARKLRRPDSKYECLSDITDVAGVRIVTYLANDVDRIARLLVKEFVVDEENSIDKRTILDPDRFGYVSVHHVVSLTPERTKLTEYSKFPSLKIEIQTRSILQHAWAEIEHDLGYKSNIAVPTIMRRRFSRLAGLLELADQEFIDIADQLRDYESKVTKRIKKEPQSVDLNKASLAAFMRRSALLVRLDKKICELVGASLTTNRHPAMIENDLKKLDFIGINTIQDLETALQDHESLIISFARKWVGGKIYDEMPIGVSLLYLSYVMLGKCGDAVKAQAFLKSVGIGNIYQRKGVADKVISTYNSIKDS
jgi:ppGpp synthetase/RelA/SpoT-type nucleotidyltranferase